MRNVIRKPKGAVLAFVGLLVVSGCTSGDPEPTGSSNVDGAYVVQIITSATGSSNALGLAGADGMQAAIESVNEAGGVNGHLIEYEVLDDQSDTTVSQTTVRTALAADPIAILDGGTSTTLTARVPAYESAGVTVVANSTREAPLASWLYSVPPTNSQVAVSNTHAAEQVLGGSLEDKKVALVSTASPAGEAASANQERLIIEAGGAVVAKEFQPYGATSFGSQANNIVAKDADVVIIVDAAPSAVVESKALADAGYKGAIITWSGASDANTLGQIGGDSLYTVRYLGAAVIGTGMYDAAVEFGFESGTSHAYFSLGWAAAHTLVKGLDACGYPCTSADLQKALDGLGDFSVPGDVLIAGDLRLSPSVHAMVTGAQVYKWDEGAEDVTTVGDPYDVGSPNYPKS